MCSTVMRDLLADLPQSTHAQEIVCGHGHQEELMDLLDAAHYHLTGRVNELGPAKAPFNELALLLRNTVALDADDLIGRSRPTV